MCPLEKMSSGYFILGSLDQLSSLVIQILHWYNFLAKSALNSKH
jgi:hypothetical protein